MLLELDIGGGSSSAGKPIVSKAVASVRRGIAGEPGGEAEVPVAQAAVDGLRRRR